MAKIPGGVLPYNSYTGLCRPTGSYFWDSDLERNTIFKPFSRTGCDILMHESFKILSAILTVERDIKKLTIF